MPSRLVRLGQVIPVRGEPGGEVYLLSYAQTGPGHQLSLFIRSTRQDGSAGPDAGILEQFTAADDRETRYQMMVRDLGGDDGGPSRHAHPRQQQPNAGGSALRIEVVPPLSRATPGIEVIATGRSARARVTLPLHWVGLKQAWKAPSVVIAGPH